MSRAYRFTLLIPAILAVLNVLSALAAAGPCPPGDFGCG
jgi:hypothetical protein